MIENSKMIMDMWATADMMDYYYQAPIDTWMIETILMIANWLSIVAFLLSAWWLFMINKKLWEKHPWLSFIPVINIWSYFTAWKVSFLKYFVYPILWIIAWVIISFFTHWIVIVVAYIYFIYCMIVIMHSISKRTGRWVWTTIWFIFIPFIMLPIVGHKLKDKNQIAWDENKESSKDKEENMEAIEL